MRAAFSNRHLGTGLLACLIASASLGTLRADFSYQESTQIVGGPLQKPVTYLLKGNRVAAVSKDHIRVIDVDRETVTEVDLVKKTYAVTTFAQIKQGKGAEVKLKTSRKETGQAKPFGVLNANEVVITMAREDIDSQIVVDAWIATVPGFDDVKVLQRKLGQKLGFAFGSPPGFEDLFDEVYKGLNRVVGVPIEFNVRRGDAAAVSAPSQAPPPQTGVAGALGRIGEVTGLGRKKNTADQAAGNPNPAGPVEMTIQLSNFSGGPADASKFEVPSGFKKLDPAAIPIPAK